MASVIEDSVDEVESTLGRRRGSSLSIHHYPEYIYFLPFILLHHTLILSNSFLPLLAPSSVAVVHILPALHIPSKYVIPIPTIHPITQHARPRHELSTSSRSLQTSVYPSLALKSRI